MICSSKQSARAPSWRNVARLGLALLFVLLVGFLGTGKAIAHSSVSKDISVSKGISVSVVPVASTPVSVGQGNAALRSSVDEMIARYASRQADRARVCQAFILYQKLKTTGSYRRSDCSTCCPYELHDHSQSYLRSKHDHEWFFVLDNSQDLVRPVLASTGLFSLQAAAQSRDMLSQLSGLSGAQIDFVKTIRLLT